jgi:hypothetical protein
MSVRPNKQSKKQQNCNIMTNEEFQEELPEEIEKDPFKKVLVETGGYYFNLFNNIVFTTIKFIIRSSGIYLLWIVIHYIAAQLYVKLCVPNTIIGFLISPFMIATPHCHGLRWIVFNAAAIINNMWILMGAWICSKLLILSSDTPHE